MRLWPICPHHGCPPDECFATVPQPKPWEPEPQPKKARPLSAPTSVFCDSYEGYVYDETKGE